jgi:hypothetical protein
MRLKLEKLWVSGQEFSRARQRCLGWIRNRDKWYFEPTLKFQLLESYKPEGELDSTLRTVEAYAKNQQKRSCYKIESDKLESYKNELLRLNDPLDAECREVESELEQLRSLEDQLDEDERL